MQSVVIFGGTGFIGTHLTQHLLSNSLASRIFLVDIKQPRNMPYCSQLQHGLRSGRVVFIEHDVRKAIDPDSFPARIDTVFNLAAVHREPGHQAHEYFETNLLGAENVCNWAAQAGCQKIVFTSSISPYGPSEETKTEASLPVPETPYGSSKLAAEKIHLGWQSSGEGRQLLILRPGVVFGPGEGGNVTRLVKSLAKGYFVYLGNRRTVKAAGYVKELCLVTMFGLRKLRDSESPYLVLNFTMDPPPTMEEMVQAVMKASGRHRRPMNLPRALLLALSYPLSGAERMFGIQFPINRVRLRKLCRSNNILPEELNAQGYRYTYSLQSAFADWRQDCPEDFCELRSAATGLAPVLRDRERVFEPDHTLRA